MRHGSLVLALVFAAIGVTSEATAKPVWINGRPFNEIYCGLDKPYGTVQVAYLGEQNDAGEIDRSVPRIGDRYYARITVVKPADCPSGNRPWEIYLRLPVFSFISITPDDTITCLETVDGGERLELPAPECATTMPKAESLPSSDARPAWNFRPSAKKALIVKPGSKLEIIIPVASKRALRPEDGSFMIPFGNFEGTGAWGEAHATVAVSIADRPLEVAALPVENLMPYGADLKAEFFNLFQKGKASFLILNPDGTQFRGEPFDLEDRYSGVVGLEELRDLAPNAEYRWKAILKTDTQTIETPLQTFRTLDGPARPMTPRPPAMGPMTPTPTDPAATSGGCNISGAPAAPAVGWLGVGALGIGVFLRRRPRRRARSGARG